MFRKTIVLILLAAVALACAVEKTGAVTQIYQGQDQYGAPQKYAVIGGDHVPITEVLYIELSGETLPYATTLSDAQGCDGIYDTKSPQEGRMANEWDCRVYKSNGLFRAEADWHIASTPPDAPDSGITYVEHVVDPAGPQQAQIMADFKRHANAYRDLELSKSALLTGKSNALTTYMNTP